MEKEKIWNSNSIKMCFESSTHNFPRKSISSHNAKRAARARTKWFENFTLGMNTACLSTCSLLSHTNSPHPLSLSVSHTLFAYSLSSAFPHPLISQRAISLDDRNEIKRVEHSTERLRCDALFSAFQMSVRLPLKQEKLKIHTFPCFYSICITM